MAKAPSRFINFFRLLINLLLICGLSSSHAGSLKEGQFVSDEEIEYTLEGWLTELFKVAGIPTTPKVFLLLSSEINAGATLGSIIIVYTGLILKCENVNQLRGVLAHEVGHIAAGHSARASQAQEQALFPAVATLLLGTAAALATGSPDVLVGGLMGGAQIFERGLLKHSRDQEETADSAALTYLTQLGWPTAGLFEFLNILDTNYSSNIDLYASTHPLSSDRKTKVMLFRKGSLEKLVSFEEAEQKFQRIKAKIEGYMDPNKTLRKYSSKDSSSASLYARAIAFFRLGKVSQALELINQLITHSPKDPFLLELKGQICFDNGDIAKAVTCYQEALNHFPQAKIIPLLLAQALLENPTANSRDLKKAIELLRNLAAKSPENAFAWRLLAKAYGKDNQMEQAALCLAEESLLNEDIPRAKSQAEKAKKSRDPIVTKRAADLLAQIAGP